MADTKLARIRSIDLLRGADVLLMLFVNEVAGVAGAPAFLRHKGAADDGMTITDLVFPAFLFVVGMAIPFALGSRLARGESRLAVLRHVVARAAALVVIGVLMVNAEHGVAGWVSLPAWNVLMTLGVLLVWGLPRDGWCGRHRGALRALGILLLLFVVVAYRGKDVSGWLQLRPYWWGILGLIGWAYLGVASLYLVIASRPAILTALLGLYGCVALADKAGGFGWPTIPGPLVGGIVGTHGAVVLAGCLLGVLVERQLRSQGSPWRFAAGALGCAAAFGAAGLLLHTLHGLHPAFTISKIHATLPWGLLSAALTTARLGGRLRDRGRAGPARVAEGRPARRREPAARLPARAAPAVALRARRPALRRRQPLRGDQPAGAARPRPFGGLRVGGRAPDRLAARARLALPALTKGVRS